MEVVVNIVTLLAKFAWQLVVIAAHLAGFAFRIVGALLSAFGDAAPSRPKPIGGGYIPFPGAEPVDPIWDRDQLDMKGRPPV